MKHLSFPSIEQFRQVVRTVSERTYRMGLVTKPIITFRGTVKSHGCNASIVYDTKENIFYAQSRSNVLSLTADNFGFCQYFETNRAFFEKWLTNISNYSDGERFISIFGEWCGGAIQKGVAINGLPKMLLVFAMRISDLDEDGNPVSRWCLHSKDIQPPENNINCYSIETFGTYDIDIDFNKPEMSQNQLVAWTESVEAECPIGKYFGNSGIGEGLVLHPIKSNIQGFPLHDLLFKCKGSLHSVSHVKTLAAVDVELFNSINEMVASLTTDNRFNQGIQVLTEQGLDMTDRKNTSAFIKWVTSDIIKEDQDVILASGLEFKSVMGKISSTAGQFYNKR